MKNKPFQQFDIPKPVGPANTLWFRRQIIFDQPTATIYIQVQWGGDGYMKREEYERIKAGLWAQYVPKEYGPLIGQCVASGYKVMPVAVVGGNIGELHSIVQIVGLEDNIRIFKDGSMTAMSDTSIAAEG